MGCMHAAVLFESQNVIFFDDKMFSSGGGGGRSSCCARKIVSTVSTGHSSQWIFILSWLRIRYWAPQTLYFSLILYNRRAAATQGAHMHMHPFTTIHRYFLSSSFSRLTLNWMLESDSRKKKDYTTHCSASVCGTREQLQLTSDTTKCERWMNWKTRTSRHYAIFCTIE